VAYFGTLATAGSVVVILRAFLTSLTLATNLRLQLILNTIGATLDVRLRLLVYRMFSWP
jgi:hypothetical protein